MFLEHLTSMFVLCLHVWIYLTNAFMYFKLSVLDWRQCDDGNDAFLTFRAIPIHMCLFKCHVRSRCHAVEFFVTRRECRLLETERSTGIVLNRRACVFIRMSDFNDRPQIPDTCQNCTDVQVCDVLMADCNVQECKRLLMKNAKVLGNMQSVGSKVKISPNPGYGLDQYSEETRCQANGEWDNVPGIITVETCRDGWFQIEKSCYQDLRIKHNFEEAETICLEFNAHVLQIETESENTQLEPHVQDTRPENRGWWIGMLYIDGQWKFTGSNSTVSFFNWHPNEPNDKEGEEPCVVIGFRQRSIQWTDVSCIKPKQVMCERRLGES